MSRVAHGELASLADLGWRAGQGLRTGANDFFYVSEADGGGVESAILPGQTLQLPPPTVRRAVRRQADLPKSGASPTTTPSGVLVLDRWALPEDIDAAAGPRPWRVMDGLPCSPRTSRCGR